MALVPRANLVLRRVPDGMSNDVALFAGDVMGTGFHAVVDERPAARATSRRCSGLGPVGLCAVQAARAVGAAHVFAIDSVPERLSVAESFGAEALHLGEQDVRAIVRAATEDRGVDVSIDAVGDPKVLDSAIRLTRACGSIQCIGVYAERAEVHMGLLWLKALTLRGGQANVIGHVDRVLAMLVGGRARPERARHAPHDARGGTRGLRGVTTVAKR